LSTDQVDEARIAAAQASLLAKAATRLSKHGLDANAMPHPDSGRRDLQFEAFGMLFAGRMPFNRRCRIANGSFAVSAKHWKFGLHWGL
jgi:hypothetical protein